EEGAVARLAHAGLGAALNDRADGELRDRLPVLAELLDQRSQTRQRQLLALLVYHGLARLARGERPVDVLGQRAPEQALVQPVLTVDVELDLLRGAAVGLADDHVLRDVDE